MNKKNAMKANKPKKYNNKKNIKKTRPKSI